MNMREKSKEIEKAVFEDAMDKGLSVSEAEAKAERAVDDYFAGLIVDEFDVIGY